MFLTFFQPQLFYCADIVKYGSRTTVDQYDYLFPMEMESDVTLVIGDIELPAHRSILSEQSEYFRAMFSLNFMESKSDKVILKEVNLNAFKHILKCMYTGSMDNYNDLLSIDEDFEVLQCAIYFAVEVMTTPMIAKLKKLHPRCLLTKALAYSIEELISNATDRLLQIVPELGPVYKNKVIFYGLSPQAVEHVLKQHLDTSESNIFKALLFWMQTNPDHSRSFPQLLEHVELHLLNDKHWNMLFNPTELIDRNFCQTLLNEQRILAQRVQKFVDQNVIKSANDIHLVDGMKVLKEEVALSLTSYWNRWITIDLKQLFVLNCLKFKLEDTESYFIYVSKNMYDWQCVLIYYECFGQQILYFDERVVRFVRIIFKNGYQKIKMRNVEALYSSDPCEIDPITTLNVPKHNIVHKKMVSGPYFLSEYRYVGKSIVYHFSQPWIIGNMKLLFNAESSYFVEVATNYKRWKRVFAEENVSGWRIATFEEQPVLFVRIVGTKPLPEHFHLTEFECPAQCNTALAQKPPLRCLNRHTSHRLRRMLRRKYIIIPLARCLKAKG